MRDRFDSRENPAQRWETDPELWRGRPEAESHGPAWPQLDAGPAYWMWLAVLEAERGITS